MFCMVSLAAAGVVVMTIYATFLMTRTAPVIDNVNQATVLLPQAIQSVQSNVVNSTAEVSAMTKTLNAVMQWFARGPQL
jgi:hypothetical protein